MESEFSELEKIISQLRDPKDGCPWDLEQTHLSLAKYLEEESSEVLEVLRNETLDYEALCDELGDVLLQVMLHAQLAKEKDRFTITDVVKNLSEKLVRRHPHVFGESTASTIEEVEKQWEEIKAQEKDNRK